MRKRHVGWVAGIAILAVAVLLSSGITWGQRNYPQIPGVPIGAASIVVNGEQLIADGWTLRAFIATGSSSPVILGTLTESNYATSILSFFCGPREYMGEQGILVSLFMHWPVGADFEAAVTIYQQGAKKYADPILYIGD